MENINNDKNENRKEKGGDVNRIFRFKIYSSQLNEEIIAFSQYHKFENKQTLKESFEIWIQKEEIRSLIHRESLHLKDHDYNLEKCPLHKKIFKSIKYYHIKRILSKMKITNISTKPNDTENKIREKKTRIKFSKSFINDIIVFMQNNINNNDFKPSTYFDKFKCNHENSIRTEYDKIMSNLHGTDNEKDDHATGTVSKNIITNYDEFVDTKIKKVFKNQYFNRFKQLKNID